MRWTLWDRLRDDYDHYRSKVGLGRLHAIYRSLYRELRKKEP